VWGGRDRSCGREGLLVCCCCYDRWRREVNAGKVRDDGKKRTRTYAITLSPTANLVTFSPTCSIVPAQSEPRMNGYLDTYLCSLLWYWIFQSTGFYAC
jgi:hypothetical protein